MLKHEKRMKKLGDCFLAEHISPFRFKEIADFVIESDSIPQTLQSKPGIIWCHTSFIDTLFAAVRESNHRYILITHKSAHMISEQCFQKRPQNIRRWYAKNSVHSHADLVPIPLGLPDLIPGDLLEYFKQKIMLGGVRRRLIYCNLGHYKCASYNKARTIRKRLEKKLSKIGSPDVLVRTMRVDYKQYLDDIAESHFVLSPPGQGPDCHRTWESLYLGATPIVECSNIYRGYSLPIMQVESLDRVVEMPAASLFEMQSTLTKNSEELKISYWLNRISRDFSKMKAHL
jgi:hypothetical protein